MKLLATASLAFRSVLWTILLPGFVAGYVPWRYYGLNRATVDWTAPTTPLWAAAMICGAALLLTCIWEFASSGRGTLSPADPPRTLVVRGLYRYVRNPMYLSVTAIVLGESLLAGSPALAGYCALWFLGVNLFVMGYEEPTLREKFGASYDDYCRQVRRWIPRFGSVRPARPSSSG